MDTTGRIGEKVRKKTKGKPFLPDDIIPNILSRLPAKSACQCRLVCRTWRDLTSTRDFVDLHFRHNFPMILVANPTRRNPNVNHLLLDKWWEPARKKLMIHTFPFVNDFHSEYRALFSHAGLVIFRECFVLDVIIVNPINLEKVTVSLARELKLSEIYGVYYHPSLREYCSLWGIELSHTTWDQPRRILYKVLNLGPTPFMKTICNPFTHKVKRWSSYPLFIDKYLYWILEAEQKHDYRYSGHSDIMQFDIVDEEFTIKPCPVPVGTECDSGQTHLLNIDGALSYLVIFTSKITIWRLVDHAEKLWTSVDYTFRTENFEYIPRPIAAVDGSLVLLSDRRLLVCNLMQGTMKCFRKRKYHCNVLFLSHQVSLASLSNCQSTIYLNEEGEVDVRENRGNSGSLYSLEGSSNSNSVVNGDSDSQLEDSGPSNPLGEESTSFEIASTDDEAEVRIAHEGDWKKKKTIKLAERCARKGLKATKQELHNCLKAVLELLKQGTHVGSEEVETGEPSSCEKKIEERFADKGKGKAQEGCGQGEEKGGLEEVETGEPSSCEKKNEKFLDKGKVKAKEDCGQVEEKFEEK